MIDAHLHLSPNFPLQAVINYLDDERIDACWLLSWEESPAVDWHYIPLTAERIYDAWQQYPERIIPMYAPDPLLPNCLEKFRRYHQLGFPGCAELKTAIAWDEPALIPLLKYLNDHRLPLTFHMEAGREDYRFKGASNLEKYLGKLLRTPRFGGMPGRVLRKVAEGLPWLKRQEAHLRYNFPGYMMDMAGLESALQRFPGIRFIGHGPFFWQCIADPPGAVPYPTRPVEQRGVIWRLLETYENLYADISGQSGYHALSRDSKNAAVFLDRFSSKLLYGTDNYFAGLKPLLEGFRLNSAVYRRIYEENARSLLAAGIPASTDS